MKDVKELFTPTIIPITYCVATSAFIGIAWSVPQPPAINARELIPLASRQKQFKVTDGKDRGRIVPLISQPDPADDQRWQLVFGDYASILFVKNLQGDPMIERLDLFKSRTYIVYEPALPLLPSAVNLVGSAELQRDIGCITETPAS